MDNGRLVRVRKYRGDPHTATYIVALADPTEAKDLIRVQASGPGDDVEDLGRVSDALLVALRLGSGQFTPVSSTIAVPEIKERPDGA